MSEKIKKLLIELRDKCNEIKGEFAGLAARDSPPEVSDAKTITPGKYSGNLRELKDLILVFKLGVGSKEQTYFTEEFTVEELIKKVQENTN